MIFFSGAAGLWERAAFDPTSLLIGAGGSLVSGLIGSGAASSAGQAQANAANNAAQVQQNMFNTTQANLQPYMGYGTTAGNQLVSQLGTLTAPFSASNVQNTPGYQFDLQQGLEGAQNSAAARGLGLSGAALKGAANYATGLADNTYMNQFNINQANQNNAYNKLMGVTGLGENAAAGLGNIGANTASSIGNTLTSGAAAQAAGTVGSANALSNALNGATNLYTTGSLLQPAIANQNAQAAYYNSLTNGY